MMLRLQYEGLTEGTQPDWVHGFYAANPENRPVTNGEQVPRSEWIHYQVDLMDVDDARQPYRITDLEVMGQGHTYESEIAAVRLIGS